MARRVTLLSHPGGCGMASLHDAGVRCTLWAQRFPRIEVKVLHRGIILPPKATQRPRPDQPVPFISHFDFIIISLGKTLVQYFPSGRGGGVDASHPNTVATRYAEIFRNNIRSTVHLRVLQADLFAYTMVYEICACPSAALTQSNCYSVYVYLSQALVLSRVIVSS